MKLKGKPIIGIPTEDGREYRCIEARGDQYTMKGGKIVTFSCKKHGKQHISEAYIWARGNGTTQIRCKECDHDRHDRKRQEVGVKPPNKHSLQEYRRYEVNGVIGKDCGTCKRWKPSSEFSTKDSGRYHPGTLYYQCRECRNEAKRAFDYLRLIREKLQPDSPVRKLAEDEKRSHYRQAMCWLSGLLTDRVLPTEKREKLSPEVRRLRDDQTKTFEEKVEALVPFLS